MTRLLRSSRKEPNLWRNNLLLLLSILILFIVGPAFEFLHKLDFINSIFFTILIISGRTVLDFTDASRHKMDLLGITTILALWCEYFFHYRILKFVGFSLLVLYLLITTILLIYHVAKSKKVNADIIFCSINGYMLLGVLGAIAYYLVGSVHPGSLSVDLVPRESFEDYIYLSYVSLSTLGYGDISPTIPASRAVSMILSISGQLYMTILIAMLVGKYLSAPRVDTKNE